MLALNILPILGVREPQLGEQTEPDACVNVLGTRKSWNGVEHC